VSISHRQEAGVLAGDLYQVYFCNRHEAAVYSYAETRFWSTAYLYDPLAFGGLVAATLFAFTERALLKVRG